MAEAEASENSIQLEPVSMSEPNLAEVPLLTTTREHEDCSPDIRRRTELTNRDSKSLPKDYQSSFNNRNEFGDTIGICKVTSIIDLCDATNYYADLVNVAVDQNHPPSTSSESFASLNTQIMNILTDLDDVLEKSLMNGEQRQEGCGDVAGDGSGTASVSADRQNGEDHSTAMATVTTDRRRRSFASRGSMRLLQPVQLPEPTAPHISDVSPQEFTLPVLLFMESQSQTPGGFSAANLGRPQSADSAPRVLGRRALGANPRSISLQASPSRAGGSASVDRTRSSSSSSRRSSSRRPRSVSSDSTSISSNDTSGAPTPEPVSCDVRLRDEDANETNPNPRSREGVGQGSSPFGTWPHGLSSMLAYLGCTVGLFNISRFAIFSVHFGANFIVQFLFLSMILGIPLFTLHLCIGQYLNCGPVDMWKISPIFKGVGLALLLAQAVMGIYSIIGVSWMFVYFRDSFITKSDKYRWAEPFSIYREDMSLFDNGTHKLSETVSDYFNGVVLKRHLGSVGSSIGNVKFQITFNLAVIWMIVFVALSKGLRSYGKVVYVFSFLPICGTLIMCAKLLSLTPRDSIVNVFPETSWNEFFINSKSWAAAAQETFLTWGLLGVCGMQLASHGKQRASTLRRDSTIIVMLTLAILLLAAFLADTCVHIIHSHGYTYVPAGFDQMFTYSFVRSGQSRFPPSPSATPVRYMAQHACLVGSHVSKPGVDTSLHSGYQVLQLATELVPSTLAIIGPDKLSSFWAVLFYFILIMFGIAQQLAIWHCVITGIMAINYKAMKSWEASVTFFSCTFGFLLGLPMATDAGIQVVHFIDYVVVGVWWQCLLQVAMICALFLIRGRPYTGDSIVCAMYPSPPPNKRCSATIAPLLSFTWNVILPVTMMALCVVDFRLGKYRQLFIWKRFISVHEYWPLWCKKLGAIIQIVPLFVVPLTIFIQTWRYLSKGPPDILEDLPIDQMIRSPRIQLLYRPNMVESPQSINVLNADPSLPGDNNSTAGSGANNHMSMNLALPDPPPKYTPPPSYSTATGARIAKMLRQSIRRSIRGVRRLAFSAGESSNVTPQNSLSISELIDQRGRSMEAAPPDYSAILVNENMDNRNTIAITNESEHLPSFIRARSGQGSQNLSRMYQSFNVNLQRNKVTTANDVTNLLRSSVRSRTLPNNAMTTSTSHQSLVNQAEPMSNTSLHFSGNANNNESVI